MLILITFDMIKAEVIIMKRLIIKIIKKYQSYSKNTAPNCRYKPTCSQYAVEAYQKRNFFYATLLTIWRILRCNPFSKGGYDPVPEKSTSSKITPPNIKNPNDDKKSSDG